MLVDSRSLAADTTIESDVCIVGAGPAGITLALELAKHGIRTALLESGGMEPDERTQRMYAGERIGNPYLRLDRSRLRYFGGTSNHWLSDIGLRARPLDSIDFEERSWMSYSGWPFGKTTLHPFYERAHELCGLGPYDYNVERWEDPLGGRPKLALAGADVATTIFQFGPRDVFEHHRSAVWAASNVDVYLYANAVEIETEDRGEVSRLRLACIEGPRIWAKARLYILATGGIENARILLQSHATHREGVGNHSDKVGRFFMEHLGIRSGLFHPSRAELLTEAGLYQKHDRDGVPIMGMLSLAEDALRREQLPNVTFYFIPTFRALVSDSVSSLVSFRNAIRDRYVLPDAWRHLLTTVRGLPNVGQTVSRQLFGKRARPEVFQLTTMAEQTPNPNSRLTLGQKRDELGLRRVRLDWRLNDIDTEGIARAQSILFRELGASGLGNGESLLDGKYLQGPIQGQWHHMGTTRMHVNPEYGVVDENSRVHGISNLFIAGSSVFPTGGYANPTLTLVALALRLADHVKKVIAPQTIR